jgi:thymidylate synthase
LNQLDGYVIPLLKSHPDTRRALVTLADPVADDVTHLHNYVSLLGVWFRVVAGKLTVTALIRSNDFVLGWPANLFQIKLLQEYVAERVGVAAGSITTVSLSAHLFLDDEKLISSVLGR